MTADDGRVPVERAWRRGTRRASGTGDVSWGGSGVPSVQPRRTGARRARDSNSSDSKACSRAGHYAASSSLATRVREWHQDLHGPDGRWTPHGTRRITSSWRGARLTGFPSPPLLPELWSPCSRRSRKWGLSPSPGKKCQLAPVLLRFVTQAPRRSRDVGDVGGTRRRPLIPRTMSTGVRPGLRRIARASLTADLAGGAWIARWITDRVALRAESSAGMLGKRSMEV